MQDITFQSDAGELEGSFCEPLGTGSVPGIVVLHEAFGLNDDIRAHCQRLADEGYLALAPNLYSRGARWRCLLETFRTLSRREGQAFNDVESARQFLAEHPRCSGKVGVIGFCMGGGFALLMAPRGIFDAVAASYGRVPEDVESLLEGACPIVGSYGGRDRTMRGHAERLESALVELDVPHDVKEYPAATHSFMNRQGGILRLLGRVGGFGHHEPSAEDAWHRVLAMFREHLH
jgi:carboxymethylenebutenolidase